MDTPRPSVTGHAGGALSPEGAAESGLLLGDAAVQAELEEIRAAVGRQPPTAKTVEASSERGAGRAARDDGGWWAVLSPRLRLRVALCCGMQSGVQLVGINAVTFFAAEIFNSAGLGDSADVLALLQTVVGLVVTLIASVLVDRIGRRALLLLSLGLLVLSLAALVFVFARQPPAWVAVAALWSYVAAFCVGVGALPWLICSEISPLALRGKITSLATGISWGSSYAVTQSFRLVPPVVAFSLLLAAAIFFFACVYIWLPETKGLSLEAIEKEFETRHQRSALKQAGAQQSIGASEVLLRRELESLRQENARLQAETVQLKQQLAMRD